MADGMKNAKIRSTMLGVEDHGIIKWFDPKELAVEMGLRESA